MRQGFWKVLAVIIITPTFAWGSLVSGPSQRVFRVDLTGDGIAERIRLVSAGKTEMGEYYQLVVESLEGKRLWEGPRVTDSENPLMFGVWEMGESLPELVADIDDDGQWELVAPAPRSDVSPTFFRVFRWKNNSFVPARCAALMENAAEKGLFTWTMEMSGEGTWVDAVTTAPSPGKLVVKIGKLRNGSEFQTAQAVIEKSGNGYRVSRWIEPFHPLVPEDVSESPKSDSVTPGAVPLVTYTCTIASDDRRNSSGAWLGSLGDILAQDRANVHRYGVRQKGDEVDNFFTTPARRQMLQSLRIVCDDQTKASILKQNCRIFVKVFSDHIEVRLAKPE